jgi:putative ubiquitin-RnfH superfamily antitoxin RatB of RatAB toxin-antitoxin module
VPNTHIAIEITYALPQKQTLLSMHVAPETSVQEAIQKSGILQLHSDIDLSVNKVGIWYKTISLSTVLKSGDRVEIYRPMTADPKEARRLRALKAQEEGRANKITGAKV